MQPETVAWLSFCLRLTLVICGKKQILDKALQPVLLHWNCPCTYSSAYETDPSNDCPSTQNTHSIQMSASCTWMIPHAVLTTCVSWMQNQQTAFFEFKFCLANFDIPFQSWRFREEGKVPIMIITRSRSSEQFAQSYSQIYSSNIDKWNGCLFPFFQYLWNMLRCGVGKLLVTLAFRLKWSMKSITIF